MTERWRLLTPFGLLVTGLLVAATATATPEARLDPRLLQALKTQPTVTVIVQLQDERGDRRPSERSTDVPPVAGYAAAKEALLKRLPAVERVVLKTYDALPMLAVRTDAEGVFALTADDRVVRVHANERMTASLEETLPAISAPQFHASRSRGTGVAVAVLDTPVRFDNGAFGTCPSPGAAGCQIREWVSFADQSPDIVMQREDEWGLRSHGSNVSGIVLGVAPEADLIGVNVFSADVPNENVVANGVDVLDGLNWVAANAARLGIVAVNMSLGGAADSPDTCNDHPYASAIQTLYRDHGILTVIASGNDARTNRVGRPACISSAIAVAAHHNPAPTGLDGGCQQTNPWPLELACFSNLNGLIDIVAPGVFVDAGGYADYSGTSMAAPHVAGAIAVMQSEVLEAQGAPRSAYWAQKTLLANASVPLVARDGRRYHRLDLLSGVAWTNAWSFGGWFSENAQGQIQGQTGVSLEIDIADRGFNVQSAYLYLEVSHLDPAAVVAELVAPNGTQVSVPLPAGQAHFTGIVGRLLMPGAFAPLSGVGIDGRWTLTLRDVTNGNQGYLLDAALLVVADGCTPDCTTGCGDDGCGGSCGEVCLIDGQCHENDALRPDNACFSCRADVDPTRWQRSDAGCFIENQCYLAQDSRPGNTCFVCDPAANIDGWTRTPDTCLVNGQCYAAGEPDPNNPCFVCDPTLDVNGWSRTPDTCLIDGQCYIDGQMQSDNPCFTCRPAQSPDAWARTDGTCLIGGLCYAQGDADPTAACRTCQPSTRPESWTLADGQCFVDGQCYADQAPQTTGSCNICDAQASPTAFVPASGLTCVAEGACAGPGTCQSGTCVPEDCNTGCTCTENPKTNLHGLWLLGALGLLLRRRRQKTFGLRGQTETTGVQKNRS